MSERRTRVSTPILPVFQAAPPPPISDPHEVARFLRPQPPIEIPRRRFEAPPPGLFALQLLGARLVTRDPSYR